jgi:hypothetical protein
LTPYSGDGILNYRGKLWGGEAAKDSIPRLTTIIRNRIIPLGSAIAGLVRVQRQARQLADPGRMLTM